MIAVGLVAKTAAGKGTVANLLEDELKKLKLSVSRVRFSDSLRDFLQELRKRGMGFPISKHTLISVAEAGRAAFTPDFLAQAAIRRTNERSDKDICIWDGLRWPEEDMRALRSFKNNQLIAIEAEDGTRYKRFVKRKENDDDDKMSFGDFTAMESRDTEKFIPEIMEESDWHIDNNKDSKIGIYLGPIKEIKKIARALKKFHTQYE